MVSCLAYSNIAKNVCDDENNIIFISFQCSSYITECADGIKTVVDMSFDCIKSVKKFLVRFLVCIGPQKILIDEVVSKKFLCSRQGFKKINVPPTRKQKNHTETRRGCDAHVFAKLSMDKRYYIASVVEEHNHILVSPNKTQFLWSNPSISQRVKNNLYTCHKASIVTSQPYRLLQVSDDGFENIGCMKRDLQNYYCGIRDKIKNTDAQLFVAQLERKREVNSAFFYDFVVDGEKKIGIHILDWCYK
jgi:hypothetical protein